MDEDLYQESNGAEVNDAAVDIKLEEADLELKTEEIEAQQQHEEEEALAVEEMEAEAAADAEEQDIEADESEQPAEPVENNAEYKPFYRQRTFAKYASKTLARAGERKILYAGPLRWKDLTNELIKGAVENAAQAQIRMLDTLKGEKFCILDLVMRTAEDAKDYCTRIRSTPMDDGWEVQASVQLDALKKGCRRPLMLYFIDYEKYKHEDQENLAELNFHNSYDRLHRLWVYIENVPEECTDDELTEAIPNCLQAIAIRNENGKTEGYGYGRFIDGRERIKVFQDARSNGGIDFRNEKLKVFPINSDYDRVTEGEAPTTQVLAARLHKLQQTLKFQQTRNRRQRMQSDPYGPPSLMDQQPYGRGEMRSGYRGRGGPMGGDDSYGYGARESAANLLHGLERLLGASGNLMGGGPYRGRGRGSHPIEDRLRNMASGGHTPRGRGGYRGGGYQSGYY